LLLAILNLRILSAKSTTRVGWSGQSSLGQTTRHPYGLNTILCGNPTQTSKSNTKASETRTRERRQGRRREERQMNRRFKATFLRPHSSNNQVVSIRSNNSQGAALLRRIPSQEGLILPSAALAWQNGHRVRTEEAHRRPLSVPAGSASDRTNPTSSNATPRRPSASTAHSRQSSSTVPTTSHSSSSLAGPPAPGPAFPLPMRQHCQEGGYYTSIHTSNVEVSSRRTTSDGRTKVKLALLGMRVERCGVCLMQFREGEIGAKTMCEHV